MTQIAVLKKTASSSQMAYIGRRPDIPIVDRDAGSWYTPKPYIDAARIVMGTIDLDPFSSALANRTIQATTILTEASSAFSTPWVRNHRKYPKGVNVWMNPPYSSGIIQKAIDIFLANNHAGNIAKAVVLVNNATDTQWFKTLRELSIAVCFTDHRISFESPDGKRISGNTRGQVFFCFGADATAAAFVVEFSKFGWCISKDGGWKT